MSIKRHFIVAQSVRHRQQRQLVIPHIVNFSLSLARWPIATHDTRTTFMRSHTLSHGFAAQAQRQRSFIVIHFDLFSRIVDSPLLAVPHLADIAAWMQKEAKRTHSLRLGMRRPPCMRHNPNRSLQNESLKRNTNKLRCIQCMPFNWTI